MKLLLVGANGQVGRELRRSLALLGTVISATRDGRLHDGDTCEAMDLARPDRLVPLLDRVHPDVIVNAAAYTAVDRAESEPELAYRVNAEAVDTLAQWAVANDALVVHYSTDYVFDGKSRRAWREDDPTSPLGIYGASKLAGETALRASGVTHFLFRTAWVYAAHGHNFLKTMLRLAKERDRLGVVDDQHGTPTSAGLIADVTAKVLQHWREQAGEERKADTGTYHLVAGGETTWCGFARAIMREATAAGLLSDPPRVDAIASSEFPTPAQRPAWSVLDTSHLQRTFDIELPDWQQGLRQVLAQIQQARTN